MRYGGTVNLEVLKSKHNQRKTAQKVLATKVMCWVGIVQANTQMPKACVAC